MPGRVVSAVSLFAVSFQSLHTFRKRLDQDRDATTPAADPSRPDSPIRGNPIERTPAVRIRITNPTLHALDRSP